MGVIKVLDEYIANQIAAGEVVERPASVVKELVENSIDAGSTQIHVYVEEGGVKMIRVVDNGCGMDASDLLTAFFRHATSKISTSRDLFRIRTLGFRGEALPSIAAIARVECVTSANASGLGHKICLEGGNICSFDETPANPGTDITVRDLFFNTPARLKYMKTLQTELGHITDVLYRISMAHPGISFTLRHNGKPILQTLGNGDLLQVIAAIYGSQTAKSMVKVSGKNADAQVEGYVSKPEVTRANRQAISLFVNGRYIRNGALNQAVLNAYHTLLPVHRYPIAILHLKMDPSLMDVNVHPAKLEVRFSKESELLRFVEEELKNKLQKQNLIPAVEGKTKNAFSLVQERIEWYQPRITPAQERTLGEKQNNSLAPERDEPAPVTPEAVRSVMEAYHFEEAPPQPELPKLFPIGQMHGTYIIAQNENGLYLIDQHAAHERIHYEMFYEKFGHPEQASQELLVPFTLEFPPAESELIRQRLGLLENMGVHLEPFGGNSFIVRSCPYWFPKGEEKWIIEEMAEWILQEKNVDLRKLREKSAILCSCKASIKANDSLTLAEMESLLDRLRACSNPYTCPHGRPIVISFSVYELKKMFKRVM